MECYTGEGAGGISKISCKTIMHWKS